MKHKTAEDAMVPLPYVYMLDINSKMDNETMSEVTVHNNQAFSVPT